MQRKAWKWATDLCMDLAALLAMDWVYLGVIPDTCVDSLVITAAIPRWKAQLAILTGLVVAQDVFLMDIWKVQCRDRTLQSDECATGAPLANAGGLGDCAG